MLCSFSGSKTTVPRLDAAVLNGQIVVSYTPIIQIGPTQNLIEDHRILMPQAATMSRRRLRDLIVGPRPLEIPPALFRNHHPTLPTTPPEDGDSGETATTLLKTRLRGIGEAVHGVLLPTTRPKLVLQMLLLPLKLHRDPHGARELHGVRLLAMEEAGEEEVGEVPPR